MIQWSWVSNNYTHLSLFVWICLKPVVWTELLQWIKLMHLTLKDWQSELVPPPDFPLLKTYYGVLPQLLFPPPSLYLLEILVAYCYYSHSPFFGMQIAWFSNCRLDLKEKRFKCSNAARRQLLHWFRISEMCHRKDYVLAIGLDTSFNSKMETLFPWFAAIDH